MSLGIIGKIQVLPVGSCAEKSQPYGILDGLQINLRIVWQDDVVQFDSPLPVLFKVLPCKKQSCLTVPWAFTQRLPPIILYVASVRSSAGMLLNELLDMDSRGTRRQR